MGLEHVIARRAQSRAAEDRPPRPDPAIMDRAVARRWLTLPRILAGAVLVAALATASYGYVAYGLARRVGVDADRLTISPVERGVFHDFIPLSGSVQPERTVFLDLAQSGQVVDRLVEEGAIVTEGQAVVRLKNSALELQISTQQQQLAQALYQINAQKMQIDDSRLSRQIALDAIDAVIAQSEQKLARLKPLAQKGIAPRADVEDLDTLLIQQRRQRITDLAALDLATRTSSTQTSQIEQALALIRTNLDESRRILDDLVIRAPIAGQLTTLDAEIGAFKSAGVRIGQIDRTDAYKLVCLVDEFYLGRLIIGQTATARIDGQDVTLRVAKIHPEVKDRQFTVDLTFLTPPPGSVRRGQTVRARLELDRGADDSLLVANGPFYDDAGGQWAFVLEPGGEKAVRRPVMLGRRTIDTIEILSGLDAGDRVVTSGYADFKKIDTLDIRASREGSRS